MGLRGNGAVSGLRLGRSPSAEGQGVHSVDGSPHRPEGSNLRSSYRSILAFVARAVGVMSEKSPPNVML